MWRYGEGRGEGGKGVSGYGMTRGVRMISEVGFVDVEGVCWFHEVFLGVAGGMNYV